MSLKYEIREQIRHIKWLCRNNLIKCEDKLNPIYVSINKIEEKLEKL